MTHHGFDLGVRDQGSLSPDQSSGSRWQVEHVALAQQFVGTHLIQNGAGVDLGCHLEGNTRGDVGLDDARDNVHRRTLGRDDAMNARGPCHLRDASDGHLDIGRSHQH